MWNTSRSGSLLKMEVLSQMEIDIVFRIAAVGILVAVLNQVLVRAGRDDQAMLTTLAGLIVVLYWIIGYISELFDTIQTLFRF